LDHLHYDDVLRCTLVHSFLLKQVALHVSRLFVRQSSNLLGSAAAQRFPGVTEIYVYTLLAEREHEYDFDVLTAYNVLAFLKRFPKLDFAFLGGLCTCEGEEHGSWLGGVRVDLEYRSQGDNSIQYMKRLLRQVCEAYACGDIAQSVEFWGILGNHNLCPYRERTSECATCRMVCDSFPPMHVMHLRDDEVPCIPQKDRREIALQRDPDRIRPRLTDISVETLGPESRSSYPAIIRGTQGCLMGFPSLQEDIRSLVELGANIRDPRVRSVLLDRPEADEDGVQTGWGYPCFTRAAIEQQSFDFLVSIGANVTRSDFEVIDTTAKDFRPF